MTCRATINQDEGRWAHLVAQGGGVWVGIQRLTGREDLVLFNDPQSGTTLSLPTGQVTAEAIARRIEESRRGRHASE